MKASKKSKAESAPKDHIEKLESLPGRRSFVVRATAVVIGGLVALFPPLAGIAMFIDPLRRKSRAGEFLKVAGVNEIPADGVPRAFSVVADKTDAWNVYPNEPVGAVYLRLTETPQGQAVEALSATCPHLGCFVDFQKAKGIFRCPCHDSSFEPSGARINPEKCPAARDMDSLEVEVRNNSEVWVKYQKFVGGSAEKIPEA